jgi:transposase
MISPEQEALILRLFHAEKWRVGTIARQLGLHRDAVSRVLKEAGLLLEQIQRHSMIDPYIPFLNECFEKYPKISAARLHGMVKERGYPGSPDHFRHMVASLRPTPPAEAFLRLKTLPGERAEVDWAHFGKIEFGATERTLWAFVMVLSYSRAIFLRFYPGASGFFFHLGHVEAFNHFNGSTRITLYDNLKSAVLERRGDAIRFHPELLALAAHYHYEPRPVAIARGNEKPRVERSIRYVRDSFFMARQWKDLNDLNQQALEWCLGPALERRWPEDRSLSVKEAFEIDKENLLPLPPDTFPAEERREVVVGKTPYIRFDCNDYTVPHTQVQKTLVVSASLDRVRILDGAEVVASHPRSFEKGQVIEDPKHIENLVQEKRRARKERGIDRLQRAASSSQELLVRLSKRGESLRTPVNMLLRLLETYGASELEAAIAECLKKDVPHPHAVRHVLEQRREAQGLDPALPIALPDNLRVRDLVVPPPRLDIYDHLKENTHDHGDDQQDDGEAGVLAQR